MRCSSASSPRAAPYKRLGGCAALVFYGVSRSALIAAKNHSASPVIKDIIDYPNLFAPGVPAALKWSVTG